MNKFWGLDPQISDYWRSIILFGKNVASYKFALANSLIELAKTSKTEISLEELAIPFSHYLTEHLKKEDKQSTSQSSRYLDVCRQFNQGAIAHEKLIEITVKLGFNNVIDAFHNLSVGESELKFFIDNRKSAIKGLTITDELFSLLESEQINNLIDEVEARWRLVETAWSLNLSRNLIKIEYDPLSNLLFTKKERRVDVTSCRDALNGYQKGKCFYCFRFISTQANNEHLADVDHFFPHILAEYIKPINGVWNLVLACQSCNRGENGKFERLPKLHYLERLNTRNEYLIASHHPLRETLIQQTGKTYKARQAFLQKSFHLAQTLTATSNKTAWSTLELDIGF